jgi:hypothetical protein
MAKNAEVIAISEMSKSAGLITWWKLGGEIDLDSLAAAWRTAGLSEEALPLQSSPTVALRRALERLFVKPNQGVDLQRIAPKGRSPGGFAVVRFSQEDSEDALQDLVFNTKFKVWLEDGIVNVACNERSKDELRRAIWQAFQEEQQKVSAHDLSAWLVRRVEAVGAVRLREGGGVYFVPDTRVQVWRTIAAVFESVSTSTIYEIPAMRSSRAVTAILDALVAEAQHEAARMNGELDQAALGERAIASRQESCKALLSKVAEYEKLLGTKMEALHGMLGVLQSRLIEAALVAE